jgi:hypothetical protein
LFLLRYSKLSWDVVRSLESSKCRFIEKKTKKIELSFAFLLDCECRASFCGIVDTFTKENKLFSLMQSASSTLSGTGAAARKSLLLDTSPRLPQQPLAAARAKPRIGNWQEEIAFDTAKRNLVQEARVAASAGGVAGTGGGAAALAHQILTKRAHHNQPTVLGGPSPDGFIRFGVPIMLQCAETQGFLSVDLHDRTGAGAKVRVAATTSERVTAPILRSTWVLLPVEDDEAEMAEYAKRGELDILHYGQKFFIRGLDDLTLAATGAPATPTSSGGAALGEPEPLYLASTRKTPQTQSARSGNQDAYFTPVPSQEAWWVCTYAHPEYRLDMDLAPVRANQSVLVLKHHITGVPLASPKVPHPNDFGADWEVSCNRYLRMQVRSGATLETEANLWAVATAPGAASV